MDERVGVGREPADQMGPRLQRGRRAEGGLGRRGWLLLSALHVLSQVSGQKVRKVDTRLSEAKRLAQCHTTGRCGAGVAKFWVRLQSLCCCHHWNPRGVTSLSALGQALFSQMSLRSLRTEDPISIYSVKWV